MIDAITKPWENWTEQTTRKLGRCLDCDTALKTNRQAKGLCKRCWTKRYQQTTSYKERHRMRQADYRARHRTGIVSPRSPERSVWDLLTAQKDSF